jgi:hypothetical protein
MKPTNSNQSLEAAWDAISMARSDREVVTITAASINSWILASQEIIVTEKPEANALNFIQEAEVVLRAIRSDAAFIKNKRSRERVESSVEITGRYWESTRKMIGLYWSSEGHHIDGSNLEDALEPLHAIGAELIGEDAWVSSAVIKLLEFIHTAARNYADDGGATLAAEGTGEGDVA